MYFKQCFFSSVLFVCECECGNNQKRLTNSHIPIIPFQQTPATETILVTHLIPKSEMSTAQITVSICTLLYESLSENKDNDNDYK